MCSHPASRVMLLVLVLRRLLVVDVELLGWKEGARRIPRGALGGCVERFMVTMELLGRDIVTCGDLASSGCRTKIDQ